MGGLRRRGVQVGVHDVRERDVLVREQGARAVPVAAHDFVQVVNQCEVLCTVAGIGLGQVAEILESLLLKLWMNPVDGSGPAEQSINHLALVAWGD